MSEAKPRSGSRFKQELYRISKQYTAAMEGLKNPRVIHLEDLSTVEGTGTSSVEEFISHGPLVSEPREIVSDEKIMKELCKYPKDVILDNDGLEDDLLSEYCNHLNRTADLFNDWKEHTGSDKVDLEALLNDDLFHIELKCDKDQTGPSNVDSEDLLDDELFYVKSKHPTTVHRVFPANDDENKAPMDQIFPVIERDRQRVKRAFSQPSQDVQSCDITNPQKRKKTESGQ